MKSLIIASLFVLSSFRYPHDGDGIVYWVDNPDKDAIMSAFGMREYSEYDVAEFLLDLYEKNDTISRKLEIKTSRAIIYGCYTYEETENQYLLTFCAEKYIWNDMEVTNIGKSEWCGCDY